MDLARCLKDLVRMLTPLPRLERADSLVGCSPALRRPSPCGRRVGSSDRTVEACSGFTCFSACALAPWLHQGLPRRLQWTFPRLNCSSGYRANRQFPGRDLHPLAFETQKVSPQTRTPQLTSDLLSCRTASLTQGQDRSSCGERGQNDRSRPRTAAGSASCSRSWVEIRSRSEFVGPSGESNQVSQGRRS